MKLASSQSEFSPWPHRLAVLLVCVTFPLIWVGGLVTTYDAGMAVPDWPTTYGYNLFLYPWQTWILGPWDLLIEHGHRLLGALTGMIALAFTAAVLRFDQRIWMRWAAFAAVVLVIFQGLLGGARVLLDARTLAMIHGCVGPLFFAFAACLAVTTSNWWRRGSASENWPTKARFAGLTVIVASLAYWQLILGAQVRHMPVMATPMDFRMAVIFHLVMAVTLLVFVSLLVRKTICLKPGPAVRQPVLLLGLIMLFQIGLGVGTWVVKYGWPLLGDSYAMSAQYLVVNESLLQSFITTLHVATGSLILAIAAVVCLRCLRLQSLAAPASIVFIGLMSQTRWEVAR